MLSRRKQTIKRDYQSGKMVLDLLPSVPANLSLQLVGQKLRFSITKTPILLLVFRETDHQIGAS